MLYFNKIMTNGKYLVKFLTINYQGNIYIYINWLNKCLRLFNVPIHLILASNHWLNFSSRDFYVLPCLSLSEPSSTTVTRHWLKSTKSFTHLLHLPWHWCQYIFLHGVSIEANIFLTSSRLHHLNNQVPQYFQRGSHMSYH